MSENNESEPEKKRISPEFIQAVKKYLEVDDILCEIKEKIKHLNLEKKENETFILDFLETHDEKIIDIPNGKLKRNVARVPAPLKKELIHKTLTEIVGDSNKALSMTDIIIKSRATIEKVTLKRTNKKDKDIESFTN